MTQMIDAGSHPAQVNSLLGSALADTPVPVDAEPQPVVQAPPDCRVELLAGLVDPLQGTTATDAVVRELTGADEEALAAPAVSRSAAKFLQAVVGRGTVSIGGEKPSPAQFDGLLIGDRELLFLTIRKATYGTDLELVTQCPHCDARDNDFVYSLTDVEVRPLQQPEDAVFGFEVELSGGRTATVLLPKAVDQDALLQAVNKNEAELNTLMLVRCVQKIDGQLVLGGGTIRSLTIKDRRTLLKAISERTPGPRIGEAKRVCHVCEKEFDLGIGLLDIFRA